MYASIDREGEIVFWEEKPVYQIGIYWNESDICYSHGFTEVPKDTLKSFWENPAL
jgi:hypothetical protein